jgi:release factor glutamine methyltransferase
METPTNSIKNFFLLFTNTLKNQYEEREIIQFLYILFEKHFGWGKSEVHLRLGEILSEKDANQLYRDLEDLAANTPIQYITKVAYFSGLELTVGPGVLIPRPETEELVELVIKDHDQEKDTGLAILDIGTGSGCIAITLKLKLGNPDVSAIDVSSAALEIARVNAGRYDCRIRFRQGDIFDPQSLHDLPLYDIIVCNPPYVLESERKVMRPNVLDFEPAAALFVPDNDPMRFNKAITSFASDHLKRQGTLYLEINERFGKEVMEILLLHGFEHIEVIRDIHGRDRFVKGFPSESLF